MRNPGLRMLSAMNHVAPRSAIGRVVRYNGGPVAFAKKLGLAHQQACLWVKQGYAPPEHYLSMEDLLPSTVSLRDLLLDLRRYRRARRTA
jgi:hypothetical protein